MNDPFVYKICSRTAFDTALATGELSGSADDRRDGFIHLSAAGQLAGTLLRHFAGADGLVLLAFSAASLGEPLKWEASRGGALFPHFYADTLPVTAATALAPIERDASGLHRLPEPLPHP